MKKLKGIITIAIALFTFTAMGTSVSAELTAPVWSSSKKGVVEFYREPGVRYRLDFYNEGEEKHATDTTYNPAETAGLYSDEFVTYHIEDRGDGNYKCRLHIVDEEGNILDSSPESETFIYTAPASKISGTDKTKLKDGKFYFLPLDENSCSGYLLEFYFGYDTNDMRSFTTMRMFNSNVAKKPKDSDGYVEIDLKSILTRYDMRVEDMLKHDPENVGEELFFSVGISALSNNPFEVGSSNQFMTTISDEELKLMRNPFLKLDLSMYGKSLNDVLILGIDKKEASRFGSLETMDVAPVIVDGFTMLPIRFVAEALGATVGWDDTTGSVTIENDKAKILIAVGEKTAVVNGETVNLDVPSFISDGRTYLPVRFASENLGAQVKWDGDTRSVIIFQ